MIVLKVTRCVHDHLSFRFENKFFLFNKPHRINSYTKIYLLKVFEKYLPPKSEAPLRMARIK